jgi:hypothetical protein
LSFATPLAFRRRTVVEVRQDGDAAHHAGEQDDHIRHPVARRVDEDGTERAEVEAEEGEEEEEDVACLRVQSAEEILREFHEGKEREEEREE